MARMAAQAFPNGDGASALREMNDKTRSADVALRNASEKAPAAAASMRRATCAPRSSTIIMQPLCFIALGGDEVVDRVQARKLGSKSADLGERGRIDLLEASSNGVHFVARLLLLPRSRPHCTALPRRRSKRFKRPSSAPPRRDSGDARTLDLKTVSRPRAPLATKCGSRLHPPMRARIGRSPARRTRLAARSQA
jgi:hypothetical protein